MNAKTKNGDTPLLGACSNGHEDMTQLLIEKGADVNAENDNGISPIQCVQNVELRYLLELHGALRI